jgi:hypothetical protein
MEPAHVVIRERGATLLRNIPVVDRNDMERRQYRVEIYRCQRAARGEAEPDWLGRWRCVQRCGTYTLRGAFYRRLTEINRLATEGSLGEYTARIVDEETGKAL